MVSKCPFIKGWSAQTLYWLNYAGIEGAIENSLQPRTTDGILKSFFHDNYI